MKRMRRRSSVRMPLRAAPAQTISAHFMADEETEQDGDAHAPATQTEGCWDAWSVIVFNYDHILKHLDFEDVMSMVRALGLYRYPCPSTTVQVTGKQQAHFLFSHNEHFNYLNLIVKEIRLVKKYLLLNATVKCLRLVECKFTNGIPSLQTFTPSCTTLANFHTLEIIGCCITKIDNLEDLCSLKMLSLCNNWIAKIENLDTLTQLTSLDLSFNNIRHIENLDKLSRIKLLNLSHNKIYRIKNIHALTDLECLNLSYNLIIAVDNLRIIENVKFVNLSYNRIQFVGDVFNKLSIDQIRIEENCIVNENVFLYEIDSSIRKCMRMYIYMNKNDQRVFKYYNISF